MVLSGKRTKRSLVRDALIDVFEPGLQDYAESRLRSFYGDEWQQHGFRALGRRIEGFRQMRQRAFAEREITDLDLLGLRAYIPLLFDHANREAFSDWPWDEAQTSVLFDTITAVRDSASHGKTELSELNAEVALLTAVKVMHLIDPERSMQLRSALAEIRGGSPRQAIGEPIHNLEPLDLPELVGRHEEMARLTTMVTRPTARAVSVTGRGGIGKTALVKRFLLDTIRFREPPFDLVLFLSAKNRELTRELEIVPLSPDVRSAHDVNNAILNSVGEAPIKSPDNAAAAAYAVLTDLRSLIVVDNLESAKTDDMLAFVDDFPGQSGSRLIFTSRDNLGRGAHSDLALQGLPIGDAIRLARAQAAEVRVEARLKRREDAAEFVESVHRNPLAILALVSKLAALTVNDLAQRVRSYSDLELQHYSWDTSLAALSTVERKVLLAMAFAQRALATDDVCAIADISSEEYDQALATLRRYHFVGAMRQVGENHGFAADADAGGYVLRLFPSEDAELYRTIRSRYLEYQTAGAAELRVTTMRDARLQQARALVRRRNYAQATTTLAEVIRMAPHHPLAYGLLAVVDLEAGNFDDARRNFRAFESREGSDAEVYQRWGYLEYRDGNYEVAVDKLTRAVELRADDPVYHHFRAVALWQSGLRNLAQMNIDRARQLFAQAEDAFQRGYFQSVRRDFEFDHNERNHTARISNLINLQDFRRAREVLAEARKQYPDAVELATLASRLDFQAGKRG
jgi:Tfp pilus assembly protein PilF